MSVKTADRPAGPRDEFRLYHVKNLGLRDGRTTAAEVYRALGPPDLADDGGRLAVYTWDLIRDEKTLPDYGNQQPQSGLPAKVIAHYLVLEFDDGGVLRRHARRRMKSDEGELATLGEVATEWRNRRPSAGAARPGGTPPRR